MEKEKRLIDANALWAEISEDNPLIHLGPFGYVACSPKTDGELVHKRSDVLRAIESAPTVDAVEVVHGRWIDKRGIPSYSAKNIPVVECSKCRCIFCDIINVHSFMYHYCPNCGAKMDGERRTDNS